MRALAEERQRSLELQVKISRQVRVQFEIVSNFEIQFYSQQDKVFTDFDDTSAPVDEFMQFLLAIAGVFS